VMYVALHGIVFGVKLTLTRISAQRTRWRRKRGRLLCGLCPIVSFMPIVESCHNLHEPVRFLQISGSALHGIVFGVKLTLTRISAQRTRWRRKRGRHSLPKVSFMPIVESCHNLHEPVRFLQISGSASPNQLLKNRHKTDYRAKAAEEVVKVQQKAKILEEMLQNQQPS
jgi:hypothetical protein